MNTLGHSTELDKFQQDKCHVCGKKILFGQAYFVTDINIGACAAGAGNWKKVHSACGIPTFHGPTFGPSAEEVAALRKDAARFRFLQNLPVVQAQAFFWNYGSRTERAKAIDKAMHALIEGNVSHD